MHELHAHAPANHSQVVPSNLPSHREQGNELPKVGMCMACGIPAHEQ